MTNSEIEAELKQLTQRVAALEGDGSYVLREMRAIQRDVAGLQTRMPEHVERLEERIGRVDSRVERIGDRLGAIGLAVDTLRADMPGIVADALRSGRE